MAALPFSTGWLTQMVNYHIVFCTKENADPRDIEIAFNSWTLKRSPFNTEDEAREAATLFCVFFGHLLEPSNYRIYKLERNEINTKFQLIGGIIKIERMLNGLRPPTVEEECFAVEKRIDELSKLPVGDLQVKYMLKKDELVSKSPEQLVRKTLGI